ncbi:lamin tail domain-containing protein [Candidatus Woesearchaeota archaeon]|nr:lamin tail domain-containing protein [Candidatus Woesearchaeota archaeon]
MKKVIIMFLLVISGVNALDNIIITEVLFNPENTEAGGEAVELYNPTEEYINISGYVILTESSATDAIIENALIRPYGFFLVADSGWSINKDNQKWVEADYEETITMSNSDSGIALIYNGTTVDAVGWGDPSSIDSDYEGTPHPNIIEGISLKRRITSDGFVDTNNNSDDFFSSAPIFRNSSYIQTFTEDSFYEIEVTTSITSSDITIISAEIIDDDYLNIEGNQINPSPGENRNINIRATIQDFNNDISDVSAIFGSEVFGLSYVNTTNGNKIYEGFIEIEYYESAADYVIYLSVNDNTNTTMYFEYMPIIGFDVEGSLASYDVIPGQSLESNVRIINMGNVNLDVEIFGADLIFGSNIINIENIEVSFTDEEEVSFNLGKNPKDLNLNLNSGIDSFGDITFRINVPNDAVAGSYSGSISIVGTGS